MKLGEREIQGHNYNIVRHKDLLRVDIQKGETLHATYKIQKSTLPGLRFKLMTMNYYYESIG